jgi:hypothetical protein
MQVQEEDTQKLLTGFVADKGCDLAQVTPPLQAHFLAVKQHTTKWQKQAQLSEC